METIKFGMIYDNDIIESIRGITNGSYSMKREIFKNMVRAKTFDKSILKEYLSDINEFLKFWEAYANDLQAKIKSAKGEVGVYTIEYQFVKDYIYAKYDYASVLQFTDGLIRGISSGKFDTVETIEDFRDHTLDKAFHHPARYAAEMLDSVLVGGSGIGINDRKPTGALDAKSFDAIRSYDLFNRRDRPELYKAIAATLEFMTQDIGVEKYFTTSDMKITVSMINNIVEYVTYSLTAYAARVYIISAYAYPFINNSGAVSTKTPISEATIADEENSNHSEITVFRNADDMICRDPAKTKEFMNIFSKFITAIKADNLFGTNKPDYEKGWITDNALDNNVFCSKLLVNPLHEFLVNGSNNFMWDGSSSAMNELNQLVRELIYNNNQGIQGTSSPKQELLHVIRGTTCENTIKAYQELAKDLYMCSMQLCRQTNRIITNIISWKKNENEIPTHNTGTLNTVSECLKVLSEFYRDLASAILQKGRDIEMHINYLTMDEINKASAGISIKIPNQKPDVDANANMMTAVPDTTRVPTELLDLYDVPTFEYMELYNEYVKMLPGMEDDLYYSEAFNLSSIIDKILSIIRNASKRFRAFLDNNAVKAAMKWAIAHEKEILAMDFTGVQLQVLPYKEPLALPKGYDKLKTGLSNFDIKKFASKESIAEYAKSLYPSETVYNWFNNDTEKVTSGADKYRSYILFKDENEATEKYPEKRQLTGSALQNTIPLWINTLKGAEDTFKAYKKIGDDIEAQINNIRSKTVSATNSTQTTSTTTATASTATQGSNTQAPPTMGDAGSEENKGDSSAGSTSNAQQTQQQEKKPEEKKDQQTDTTDLTSEGLTAINVAVTRLYVSLSGMFVEYIKAEYAYLKEAYAGGTKPSHS